MKRLITICTIIFVLAVGSAQADMITNGSFETGDLAGWSTTIQSGGTGGSVSVVTSHTDPGVGYSHEPIVLGTTSWAPTDGSNFALVKTGGFVGHFTQLYQSFTAPAGYVLSFDYFWDSQDYRNDTSRGKLLSGPGTGGTVVANLFSESVATDPGNYYGTPWTSVSSIIPSAGTYTLLFEIAHGDLGDLAIYDSYVGIDNAQVVPVPAAVLLGVIGLGAAGLKLRKFA